MHFLNFYNSWTLSPPQRTRQGVLASMTATTAKTFFQTLSRLFQFAENVSCRQTSLELISWALHSSLERERKFLRHLFTSSINGKEMYKKVWCKCKLDVLLYKPIDFLTFSLPSPSSLLKLLAVSQGGWGEQKKQSAEWLVGERGEKELCLFSPSSLLSRLLLL